MCWGGICSLFSLLFLCVCADQLLLQAYEGIGCKWADSAALIYFKWEVLNLKLKKKESDSVIYSLTSLSFPA